MTSSYESERRLILQEMVAKLIVTILILASIILLGLTIQSTGELSWYIAVIVFGGSIFLQQTLNGPPLNSSVVQDRVQEYLSQHIDPKSPTLLGVDKTAALETLGHFTKLPILRRISTNLLLRILAATIFGVIMATVDRTLVQPFLEFLGQDSIIGRVLSGLILLTLIYTTLGILQYGVRYKEDTWYAELKQKLRRTFPITTHWDHFVIPILIEAFARALLSVIARETALAIIPPMFNNVFLPWFIIATCVMFVTAGGYIIWKAKRTMDAARTLLTPAVEKDKPSE